MTRLLTAVAIVVVVAGSMLVAGCSDTVRLPDCGDCRPVEMRIDQTLEIDLGSSRELSDDPDAYEWVVTDAGTMELVGEDHGTRSDDEDEFQCGYSTYVIYLFEPTAAGTTQMRFQAVPTGTTGPATDTLDITVNVAE